MSSQIGALKKKPESLFSSELNNQSWFDIIRSDDSSSNTDSDSDSDFDDDASIILEGSENSITSASSDVDLAKRMRYLQLQKHLHNARSHLVGNNPELTERLVYPFQVKVLCGPNREREPHVSEYDVTTGDRRRCHGPSSLHITQCINLKVEEKDEEQDGDPQATAQTSLPQSKRSSYNHTIPHPSGKSWEWIAEWGDPDEPILETSSEEQVTAMSVRPDPRGWIWIPWLGRKGPPEEFDRVPAEWRKEKEREWAGVTVQDTKMNPSTSVNLDFDARLPIPISVFPSTYRSDTQVTEETTIKVDGQANLPSGRGREGIVDSRYSYSATGPGKESFREETRIYEDNRGSRRQEDIRVDIKDGRDRRASSRHEDIHIDVKNPRGRRDRTEVDIDVEFERSHYRQPFQRYADAQFDVKEKIYDQDYRAFGSRNHYRDEKVEIDVTKREPRQAPEQSTRRETVTVTEDQQKHKRDMGYYDDEGHYHSFRQGLHNAADRILHPLRQNIKEEIDVNINMSGSGSGYSGGYGGSSRSGDRSSSSTTITIPCHHIRIGDLLLLQGRICQVIKISVSNQTGHYRYLGVDLFTKQLYEETSFVSNPSPNVHVQNMLGPVFKQYRILDIGRDGTVVAITESGDIKQGLPILDQGGLFDKLSAAFEQGRSSVRVLVINDNGRELAVDMKVSRGANL